MSGKQTIPARHGTATFVPKGHTIKIINTYGHQVVDTWAFALYPPPTEKELREERERMEEEKQRDEESEEKKIEEQGKELAENADEATSDATKPKQESAEWARGRRSWGSYVPYFSLGRTAQQGGQQGQQAKKEVPKAQVEPSAGDETTSKGWSAYLPSGRGFTSYLPSKSSMSAFAASHHRDPEKSYAEQLYEFSKTPVGAAGLSAATGSGYASTMYAAYNAYHQTALARAAAPPMEYMSMAHSRASTGHMVPRVGDALVSNLRAPLLTLVEDTSAGAHDTLVAACDPQRYRELGVERWEEHGSCAENLVLALQELNERNGLKGAKAVGADVSVNSVPAPLNLFMNIPWTADGDIEFKAPTTKRGDYVRLRAEHDCVVVMSACPQDILEINGKKCMVAHFVVEDPEGDEKQKQKQQQQQQQQPSTRPRVGSRQPSGTSTSMRNLQRGQSGTPAAPERKPSEMSVESSTPQTPRKKPKKLEVRSPPNGVQSPGRAKSG